MDFVPQIPNPISKKEAEFKNSLVLAFVGDCVQELYVKGKLALTDDHKSGALHQKAIAELSAKSQSIKCERMLEMFTEEEMNVYRRAKNCKPKSHLPPLSNPKEFGLRPYVADCQSMDQAGIAKLLQAVLAAFPMAELQVHLPRWLDALEPDHPVKAALYQSLLQRAGEIGDLGQAESVLASLAELEQVQEFRLRSVDLGSGVVSCTIVLPDALFYEILSAKAGIQVKTDAQLLTLLSELSDIRREYDKISAALASVKATGYGVVMPTPEEMKLEKPEILKRGGSYGVRLKAGAPSMDWQIKNGKKCTFGKENQVGSVPMQHFGDS